MTKVDLNIIMVSAQAAGIELNETNKKKITTLFNQADQIENLDGNLSEKELDYFCSNLKLGNSTKIKNNAQIYQNKLKRIDVIDKEICKLYKLRKEVAEKPFGQRHYVGGGAAVGGGIAALTILSGLMGEGALASASALCMTTALGPAVLIGGVVVGAVAGYLIYNSRSEESKNQDKLNAQKREEIDNRMEELRKEKTKLSEEIQNAILGTI